MSLHGDLAQAVGRLWRESLERERGGVEPEMAAAEPMLRTQAALSCLPSASYLLMEQLKSREGHHLFIYPFAGRKVHLGLASVLAWRWAQRAPSTFSLSVNDYGLEILSADPIDTEPIEDGSFFSSEGLSADLLASLGANDVAQRRFRNIARIAGLVFAGFPGRPHSTKQLQASSSLFFEVFKKHDPDNLLLMQAHQEALSEELEVQALSGAMDRRRSLPVKHVHLKAASPLCLPLWVSRLRHRLSSETLAERLARMIRAAEREAQRVGH